MKRIIKNNIFGFILGIIIMSGIGVLAINYLYNSTDVLYEKSDKTQVSVKESLDELYNLQKNVKEGHDVLRVKSVSSQNPSTYVRYNYIYCYFNADDPERYEGESFLYNTNGATSTATTTFTRNDDEVIVTAFISAFNTTNYLRTITLTITINGELIKTVSNTFLYNGNQNWELETVVDLFDY